MTSHEKINKQINWFQDDESGRGTGQKGHEEKNDLDLERNGCANPVGVSVSGGTKFDTRLWRHRK